MLETERYRAHRSASPKLMLESTAHIIRSIPMSLLSPVPNSIANPKVELANPRLADLLRLVAHHEDSDRHWGRSECVDRSHLPAGKSLPR